MDFGCQNGEGKVKVKPLFRPWPPLASPWPPWASFWPPLGLSWPPLGLLLASLGLPLASLACSWPPLGVPLASLGLLLASVWPIFGIPWPPKGKRQRQGKARVSFFRSPSLFPRLSLFLWLSGLDGFPHQGKGRGKPSPEEGGKRGLMDSGLRCF